MDGYCQSSRIPIRFDDAEKGLQCRFQGNETSPVQTVQVDGVGGVIFRELPVPAMPTCGVLWIERSSRGLFPCGYRFTSQSMWITCWQVLGYLAEFWGHVLFRVD